MWKKKIINDYFVKYDKPLIQPCFLVYSLPMDQLFKWCLERLELLELGWS